MPWGRSTTARAPASIALKASEATELPLTTTMGVGLAAMILRVAPKPSSLGM